MAPQVGIVIRFEREKYETPEEEQAARVFTISQLKYMRNLLSTIAQEKLGMPATEADYQLKQEYSRGQLEIVQFLLASHDTAVSAMRDISDDPAVQNPPA